MGSRQAWALASARRCLAFASASALAALASIAWRRAARAARWAASARPVARRRHLGRAGPCHLLVGLGEPLLPRLLLRRAHHR